MIPDDPESSWKQHFPTYSFEERDIVLEEYRTAAKSLESEERVFLNASNIVVIVAAGLGSLAVGTLEPLTKALSPVIAPPDTVLALLFLTAAFAYVTVRYFADRQKAVVFAARKVIVLRRMLGLGYGPLQLVLPNWRLEGADEPFAVRLFPGWNSYVAYPFYLIAGISGFVIFYVSSTLIMQFPPSSWTVFPSPALVVLAICALWVFALAHAYRTALLDTHERSLLLFAQQVAGAIRLGLVHNFEYVIYRATLARYEVTRLAVDLSNLKKLLVFIEDRTFYKHRGVSLRATLRALLGLVGFKRRSGGSTITQQLVRTLFIREPTKLVRRKVVELLLAFWFNPVIPKEQQLELYLASVRFERGVFGVMAAMKHFLGETKTKLTKAEAFFLIERVSNIESRVLVDKIRQTGRAAVRARILSPGDLIELVEMYERSVRNRLLHASPIEIQCLRRELTLENK